MATLTIRIDNESIIPSLQKVLEAMEGVVVLALEKRADKSRTLNSTTEKAINDVKAGKTFKASSVEDLFNQCLS